ncbi:MAG TPA: hypothetical protein P5297_07725 [Bacilli bacterium]|nr:hypothetical protein [Bacilli bacterium]
MKIKIENLQKFANSIARKRGYGTATEVIFSPERKIGAVISRTKPGYRKCTTGEYVPKKYLRNFGWKNTYYCHAKTVVELPISIVDWQ